MKSQVDSLPVTTVDAGKFLHQLNMGAQAQVALFEQHVKQLGNAVNANWRLVSLDRNSLVIEDANLNKYYQGDIKHQGKGRVNITNIRELRIVESKTTKEESFRKNLAELVHAICEDDLKSADAIFGRVARQRFRPNVIPESGYVAVRDGTLRYVKVTKDIVESSNKKSLIKNIAETLKGGVKVNRGRIVEAVFNNTIITIPINELTRRKTACCIVKETAQKAYLSEGFQNRIKHIAQLVSENKLREAVEISGKFLTENQEFCLLNLRECRELIGSALATGCCFNKQLSDDVGNLFYRTNCRINRDVILTEWRKTARMTEYAPFVENVRKLEESKDFENDYQAFLDAIFVESSKDLKLQATEHLITLKAIRDLLTVSEEHKEDLEQIQKYINELEVKKDNVDDASILEVRNFLSGLSEEIIDAAGALGDYSNPNAGTMSTFDSMATGSQAEPKMFGDADLGGVGESLPLGGDTGGMEAGAEGGTEGAEGGLGELGGEEGGEGEEGGLEGLMGGEEGGEEDLGSLLAADVQRPNKPLNEDDADQKDDKSDKDKKSEDGKDGKGGKKKWTPPWLKKDAKEVAAEDIQKIRQTISGLSIKDLKAEFDAWNTDAARFFQEDGINRASVQLHAYIDHARALKENSLVAAFQKILVENTPVSPKVAGSDDPYAYQAINNPINKNYKGLNETHETMQKGVPGRKEAMTIDNPEKSGASQVTYNKQATLKKGGGQKINSTSVKEMPKDGAQDGVVCCKECKAKHQVIDCLSEDTTCPSCGADMFDVVMEALQVEKKEHQMDCPEGKGVQNKSVGEVNVGGGGKKPSMDSPDGKGVQSKGVKKVEGTDGKGAKSGSHKGDYEMDCPDGKSIAKASPKSVDGTDGSGARGTTEGAFKNPTTRRTLKWANRDVSGLNEEVDDVVSRIAEAMDFDDPMTEPHPESDEELGEPHSEPDALDPSSGDVPPPVPGGELGEPGDELGEPGGELGGELGEPGGELGEPGGELGGEPLDTEPEIGGDVAEFDVPSGTKQITLNIDTGGDLGDEADIAGVGELGDVGDVGAPPTDVGTPPAGGMNKIPASPGIEGEGAPEDVDLGPSPDEVPLPDEDEMLETSVPKPSAKKFPKLASKPKLATGAHTNDPKVIKGDGKSSKGVKGE
jgi:hypothetical protein